MDRKIQYLLYKGSLLNTGKLRKSMTTDHNVKLGKTDEQQRNIVIYKIIMGREKYV